jgi:hypothetical protein
MGSSQPGVRATLRSLLSPSRLLPVVLVSSALVWAQAAYNQTPLRVPLALALCAAFVFVAPVSWRMLFHAPSAPLHAIVLSALYLSIGVGVISSLGLLLPRWLHMQPTLMTEPAHLIVCVALFATGGWGLGRHIALEAHLSAATERVAWLSLRNEETQVLALRSQLDPHFLFNTLNAIAEWCIVDGAVAERAVLQLSSMLRAVLAGVRAPTWPLREELALIDALCELHRLRDPALFEFDTCCGDGADEATVPPMLLLPLVENAIKHGPMAGHRGPIAMDLSRSGDRLSVQLSNPGPYAGPRAGSEGLPTLRRRLDLIYAKRARFTIGSSDERRTVVELEVPLSPSHELAA